MKLENKLIKLLKIGIIIICIIILIIVILILKIKNNANNIEDTKNIDSIDSEKIELEKVTDKDIFFSINQCVNDFYNNKYVTDENKKTKLGSIYQILDKDYIESKGITEDNIEGKINIFKQDTKYIATEIYKTQKIDKYIVYIVKGIPYDKKTEKYVEDTTIYKIREDITNSTYTLEPSEENDIKNIKIANQDFKDIDVNNINHYNENNFSEQDVLQNYIQYYRLLMKNDTTTAYNLLDDEYKEKKFKNIEEFNKYVENNKTMSLYQYYTTQYSGYLQYVAELTTLKYISINEISAMNFKILLDDYTVDGEEFIKKYNSAGNKGKVSLNTEKIISALNDKDYEYVYNKLDETFKNNNFDTLEKFEKYVEENIFKKFSVQYTDYEEKGSTYIIKFKMTESMPENFTGAIRGEIVRQTKDMTVIMQLKDNRDFVMSFSM